METAVGDVLRGEWPRPDAWGRIRRG